MHIHVKNTITPAYPAFNEQNLKNFLGHKLHLLPILKKMWETSRQQSSANRKEDPCEDARQAKKVVLAP